VLDQGFQNGLAEDAEAQIAHYQGKSADQHDQASRREVSWSKIYAIQKKTKRKIEHLN
jgi:hypothetical protein